MLIKTTQLSETVDLRKTNVSNQNCVLIAINSRNGLCHMCGQYQPLFHKLTELEHLVPRNKGGNNSYFNLKLACAPCNADKQDRFAHPVDYKAKTELTFEDAVDFFVGYLRFEYRFLHNDLADIVNPEIKTRRNFNAELLKAYHTAKARFTPTAEDNEIRQATITSKTARTAYKPS